MTAIAPMSGSAHSSRTACRHVLVVLDDACTAQDLCTLSRAFVRDMRIEALVIAPAHGTATTEWLVDEQAARAEAADRLRTCVASLNRDGISASGEVGDPDPLEAMADALYEFPAEEILLVTAPQPPSRWLRENQ